MIGSSRRSSIRRTGAMSELKAKRSCSLRMMCCEGERIAGRRSRGGESRANEQGGEVKIVRGGGEQGRRAGRDMEIRGVGEQRGGEHSSSEGGTDLTRAVKDCVC